MVQRIKKDRHEKSVERRNFYISLFIMAIMLLSIVGFAMMNSNQSVSTEDGTIPKELEFKQVEQDGQIFWVAIKNYEIFIFETIDGYDARVDMQDLANQIKSKKEIKIYVDNDFESSDAIFMVDKVLNGLQITSEKVQTKTCDENTLVLTNNKSFEGNCMKFISNKGEEYKDINILVYHLVQ